MNEKVSKDLPLLQEENKELENSKKNPLKIQELDKEGKQIKLVDKGNALKKQTLEVIKETEGNEVIYESDDNELVSPENAHQAYHNTSKTIIENQGNARLEPSVKKSSLFKKTGKITTSTDVLLILLSYTMFICAIVLDRTDVDLQYKIKYGVAPGILLNPIIDVHLFSQGCTEEFESPISYMIESSSYDYSQFLSDVGGGHHRLLSQEAETQKEKRFVRKGFISTFMNSALCIKRLPDIDMTNTIKYILKDEKCEAGYRQCGLMSSRYKNKICVKEEFQGTKIPCPLNNIEIRDLKDKEEDEFKETYRVGSPLQGKVKYQVEDKIIEFSYDQVENESIISLAIADNPPCLQRNRYEFILSDLILPSDIFPSNYNKCAENGRSYPLTKAHDLAYSKVYSEPINKFYRNNDLLELVEDILIANHKDLDFLEGKNISLWKRAYIDLDYGCTIEGNPKIDFFRYKASFDEWKTENFILVLLFMVNVIIISSTVSFSSLVKLAITKYYFIYMFGKIILLFCLSGVMLFYSYSMRQIITRINEENLVKIFYHNTRDYGDCVFSTTVEKWNAYDMDKTLDLIDVCSLALFISSFIFLGLSILQSLRSGMKIYHAIIKRKSKNVTALSPK